MAPSGYISCQGCGQLYKRDSEEEMIELVTHDCDEHTCGYDDCVDGSECTPVIEEFTQWFWVLKTEDDEYVDFGVLRFSTTDCLMDATRFRTEEAAYERIVTIDDGYGPRYHPVRVLLTEKIEELR